MPSTDTSMPAWTNLVFEPYVSAGNDAVQSDTWQTWNVAVGNLYSTREIGNGTPLSGYQTFTLAQLEEKFPSAVVVGVALNVGSGNPHYDIRVDAVNFNGTVYDFETAAPRDTAAPTVPTNLRWTNPAVACGGTTTRATIRANWDASSDNIAVASYEYSVKTPLRTSWDAAWTTNVGSTTSLAGVFNEGEGTYTFRVRVFDAAGNTSPWSIDCAITYDATPTAVSKDSCKNNGWKSLFTSDNKEFKNQGACVSYVQANENASFKR